MEEDVDDRYAGIDIDSLLNRPRSRSGSRRSNYGSKKALYEAPEFIRRLSGEETVMEGQSILLECKVRGFPVPSLRWFKDDEEILDHPRIKVESDGKGGYSLCLNKINKGDEAAYRCRAENIEGACSCCFFLSVRVKRTKKRKRGSKCTGTKRSVSFPPMFATIVEKVEEEEKQGKEFELLPPSPMTDSYYALNFKGRQTWPTFLGDWAFANAKDRSSPEPMTNGDATDQTRSTARRSLRRSDLAARAEAKRHQRLEEARQKEEERKRIEEEEEKKKLQELNDEEAKKLEESRRKVEEREELERRKRTEAMKIRKRLREERLKKEDEEKKKTEEEQKKKEEEERAKIEEQRRKDAEENKKIEEQKRKEEEQRKAEEEQKKKIEEERKKEVEQRRKIEEQKRREDEQRKRDEEQKRRDEEQRRQSEQEAKLKRETEESLRKEEEERKKREEEKREKDEAFEKKRVEAEERRKIEIERKKRADDEKRKEELKQKIEAEQKMKEEELQKKKAEEEEKKRKEELKQKIDAEKKKKEEELKMKKIEEDQRKRKEEDEKREEERKRRDREEEERRLREEKRRVEEERKKEEDRIRKLKEEKTSADARLKDIPPSVSNTAGQSSNTTATHNKELKDISKNSNQQKPVSRLGDRLDRFSGSLDKSPVRQKFSSSPERSKFVNKLSNSNVTNNQVETNIPNSKKPVVTTDKTCAPGPVKASDDKDSKSSLQLKQQQQKEELKQKEKEEAEKKRIAQETIEKERLRVEFRKEKMRREQLRRQHEEDLKRKEDRQRRDEEERRKQEEEELRKQMLEHSRKKSEEIIRSDERKENIEFEEEDEDFQVKVYKRDYSFADLRKCLENQVGGGVINEEEHKYWDDILEKHNVSISDLKKSFDSNSSAFLDLKPRSRMRRKSIELDSEIYRVKRSASISDIKETYTNSLERPRKKSVGDAKKRIKDEEFLKMAAPITNLRQQFSGSTDKETKISSTDRMSKSLTSSGLSEISSTTVKSISDGHTTSVRIATSESVVKKRIPKTKQEVEVNRLAVNVASKRASFHDIASQAQRDRVPEMDKFKKRMSIHGYDAYGSREIPVYRRVSDWSDDIGKSKSSGKRGLGLNLRVDVDASVSSEKAFLSPTSPEPDDLDDTHATRIRPFVYNSIRTIARRFSKND